MTSERLVFERHCQSHFLYGKLKCTRNERHDLNDYMKASYKNIQYSDKTVKIKWNILDCGINYELAKSLKKEVKISHQYVPQTTRKLKKYKRTNI